MADDLAQGASTSELDDIRDEIAQLAASGHRDDPPGDAGAARRRPRGRRVPDPRRRRDRRASRSSSRSGATDVLALQAPVASDLRQIVAAVKMIAEIERSADLAVNICKAARRIYGIDLDPKLRGIIAQMGEQAAPAVPLGDRRLRRGRRRARRRRIDDMDDLLDGLQRRVHRRQIFESHAARPDRPAGRRAAGARRPLLRADRRPRREHRRAGALHGHRLAPEPRPRSGRLRLRRRSTRAR